MIDVDFYRRMLSSNSRQFLINGSVKGIIMLRSTQYIAFGFFESYEIVACVHQDEEGRYKRNADW